MKLLWKVYNKNIAAFVAPSIVESRVLVTGYDSGTGKGEKHV
jgi:hypothetical protein